MTVLERIARGSPANVHGPASTCACLAIALFGFGCDPVAPAAASPATRVDVLTDPPECLLDRQEQEVVQATANAVFAAVAAEHPDLAGKSALVNARRPNSLPLWIVFDPRRALPSTPGMHNTPLDGACLATLLTDFRREQLAAFSVGGVCRASSNAISCSAEDVRAILASEGPSPASPTLFYVLAHELGHLVASKPVGELAEPLVKVDLAQDDTRKLLALRNACAINTETLADEEAADQVAMHALAPALLRAPFATDASRSGPSVVSNTLKLFFAIQEVVPVDNGGWWLESPDGVVLQQQGVRDVCDVMTRHEGMAFVPLGGGDHPHEWKRLSELIRDTYWLARDNTTRGDDDKIDRALGNMADLRYRYAVRARILDDASNKFCLRVHQYDSHVVDCVNWHPAGGTDVLKPDLNPDPPVQLAPLPFQFTPRALTKGRDIELSGASAQFLLADCADDYRGLEKARAAQASMAKWLGSYWSAFSAKLAADGGVWLHDERTEVLGGAGDFAGEFGLGGKLKGIVVTKTPLKLRDVAGWDDLRRLCRLSSRTIPVDQALFEVRMWFDAPADERPRAIGAVFTKPMTLAQIFDVAKSSRGLADFPGADVVWLGSAVERALQGRYKRKFSFSNVRIVGSPYTSPLDLSRRWGDAIDTHTRATSTSIGSQISSLSVDGHDLSAGELAELLGKAPHP